MARGKEKVKEDEKTTSFVLFGRRIQIGDRETKECVGGSSGGSDCSITRPTTDSQDGNSNFRRSGIATTLSHPSTSASTTILPSYHNHHDDKNKKRKLVGASPAEGSRKKVDKRPEPATHPRGWQGAVGDMGAMEPTFISEKDLTISDKERQQNRLLLPKGDVIQRFLPLLTEEEKARLMEGGIPAVIVDREGRRWDTTFNCWSSKSYSLNGDWTKLVRKCGLSSTQHAVEVYAFRHGGEKRSLGFVVLHQSKHVDTELKL